ncbi:MAG: hypothetical protein KDA37_12225 [Planctomycetales bacterium]|nr:hypothetical protein [Planctomycetales bacterium]
MTTPQQDSPVDAAVTLSSKGLGVALLERLTGKRKLDGAQMHCVTGLLDGKQIACVWPNQSNPDWPRLIHALIAAHRPPTIIAAGDVSPPENFNGPGGVLRVAADTPFDDQWLRSISQACGEAGLPVTVLAVVADPLEDHELQNVADQPSAAGKAGAVMGGLWRRPGLIRDAWRRLSSRWDHQDQLADAVAKLLHSDAPLAEAADD